MTLIGKGKRIGAAAAGAGMCERTGRKYRKLGRLPSECRAEHTWRTRDHDVEKKKVALRVPTKV